MQVYKCKKGCCSILITNYTRKEPLRPRRRNYRKAGVFIYDPDEDRVLLVQSRGQLWGPPKGTLELGENDTECAVREVKEETGLDVIPSNFSRATKVKNRAVYFYLERSVCPISIQNDIEDNDANGITWIKIDCLEETIKGGKIVLNQHCKIVFERFMNRIFPKSGFVKVQRKKKKLKTLLT